MSSLQRRVTIGNDPEEYQNMMTYVQQGDWDGHSKRQYHCNICETRQRVSSGMNQNVQYGLDKKNKTRVRIAFQLPTDACGSVASS